MENSGEGELLFVISFGSLRKKGMEVDYLEGFYNG
jgi:hypothetical protein